MKCPDCGKAVHPRTWPDICPHCHAFLCDESIRQIEERDTREEIQKHCTHATGMNAQEIIEFMEQGVANGE